MPTAPSQTLAVNQFILVEVANYASDGLTLDTTETLTLSANFPAVVGLSIDPSNNRLVRIVGLSTGNASVTVSAPGVPANAVLTIPVSVTAPPNLSRIDFVGVTGPFPV